MEELALSFRIWLGLILVVAGALKLRDRGFEAVVRDYGVLPDPVVRPVASLLPPVELATGVALLVGVATRWAATLTAALLGAFAAGVALNLFRGRRIDCGCFGVGSNRTIGWPLVLRDLALVAMAATVAVRPPSALSPGGPGRRGLPISGAVAVAATAVVVLLTFLLVTEGWRLRRAGVARRGGAAP